MPMDTKDLIRYFEPSVPPEFRAHTPFAVELYFKIRPSASYTDPDTRQGIVQAAALLHEKTNDAGMGRNINDIARMELSPDNIIRSKEELKGILPIVEDMRISLFGVPGVPFKDFARASKWLRDESRKEALAYQKKNLARVKDLPDLREKIFTVLDKWNEVSEWKSSLTFELVILPMAVKRNGKYFEDAIKTSPGTALYDFALKTKKLEKTTRFTQPGLVYFTLAGITPTARIYDITRSKTVDIKIYRPPSDKEFYQLSRLIKNRWKRGKKLNEKCLQVYEFIDSRGGLPRLNKMIFWETSWKAWNKKYPRDKFMTSGGLRMAYVRVHEKLPLP